MSATTKNVKIPGPDHPIAIAPNPRRVVVTVAGRTIAYSRNALTMREGSYPPVHYIPRTDVHVAAMPDYVQPKPGVRYLDQYEEDWYVNARPKVQAAIVEAMGGR